ncbi:uncharacterized protein Dana_GF27873 [Drosophila ananassae]|uniref:Uncharacterized protein n=1 Tax=Drosophila ananassae TaxID=7217 RepID=A0A0P8XQH9_DROAN|nr:uncharacterized protein LOC26515282 [Drosophila ananassae]KPU76831.1 uncharacterized protein Dana_GF27873 [Drosophila ananassae]
MQTLRSVWLLGFILLIGPSLVRSQIYSLPEVGNCVNIYLNAISDITGKIMGLLHDLVKCVKLVTTFNVEALDYSSFKNVVNEFMVKLTSLPVCPLDSFEALRALLKPHMKIIKSYKCSYLGVPAKCIPKTPKASKGLEAFQL